jgi:hypothetical protein
LISARSFAAPETETGHATLENKASALFFFALVQAPPSNADQRPMLSSKTGTKRGMESMLIPK